MFKRKLQALGFPNPDTFNSSGMKNTNVRNFTLLKTNSLDEKQFQNVVIWLEDQKIRRYKIQEREPIKNTAEKWNEALSQYLVDLDCPIDNRSRPEILDWLLGLAVQLEFTEKAALYTGGQKVHEETSIKSNPLDNLDCKYFPHYCTLVEPFIICFSYS